MRRSEHQEQVDLVARVRNFYPDVLFFAVPNGGKRGMREAVRLKAEGVLAGVPDLVFAEPRGTHHGLYLEMKRVGGRVSAPQARIIASLLIRGYAAEVAEGVDEALKIVERYLALPPHGFRELP